MRFDEGLEKYQVAHSSAQSADRFWTSVINDDDDESPTISIDTTNTQTVRNTKLERKKKGGPIEMGNLEMILKKREKRSTRTTRVS